VQLIVRAKIVVTVIVGRKEINNLQEEFSCPEQDADTPFIGGKTIVLPYWKDLLA
jgi:hypothetical protein